jgi:nitroreductase
MKQLFLALLSSAICIFTSCNSTKQISNEMENKVIETIMNRRSIRAYKPEAVDRKKMDIIAKCGINAPNGMNSQQWEVRIVDNPEFINGTTKIYVDKMKNDPRGASMVQNPDFKNMYRNAPTVIFIAIKEGRFTQIDCGLMSENMILAAQSMGIGSVCLGGPVDFLNSPEASEYIEKLNFSEGYKLALVIGFGYPDQAPEAKPRDSSKIKWID